MPYVDLNTIHNPATGNVAPAAWGDGVRDNGEFFIDPPQCSVFHNTTQSISSGAITVLSANSENYDNNGMHSTVSNTSRITCQTAGRYALMSTVEFAFNNTSSRFFEFYLNGTTRYFCQLLQAVNDGVNGTILTGSRTLTLAVADYVEVRVSHLAGVAINVTLHEFRAKFDSR